VIWQIAGAVGINPLPLTLRELVWMAESRNQSVWHPWAVYLSMFANVNRDKKKKPSPFTPQEFMPGYQEVKKEPDYQLTTKETMTALKAVFCKGK